ncbi:MAG: hypothetical protein ABI679_14925 [Gemmatimonadota bacterium]
MSHEDFARYVDEGLSIDGHTVTMTSGPDNAHLLRVNRSTDIPLTFGPNEGFESRVEKIVAAMENWGVGQQSAA